MIGFCQQFQITSDQKTKTKNNKGSVKAVRASMVEELSDMRVVLLGTSGFGGGVC